MEQDNIVGTHFQQLCSKREADWICFVYSWVSWLWRFENKNFFRFEFIYLFTYLFSNRQEKEWNLAIVMTMQRKEALGSLLNILTKLGFHSKSRWKINYIKISCTLYGYECSNALFFVTNVPVVASMREYDQLFKTSVLSTAVFEIINTNGSSVPNLLSSPHQVDVQWLLDHQQNVVHFCRWSSGHFSLTFLSPSNSLPWVRNMLI